MYIPCCQKGCNALTVCNFIWTIYFLHSRNFLKDRIFFSLDDIMRQIYSKSYINTHPMHFVETCFLHVTKWYTLPVLILTIYPLPLRQAVNCFNFHRYHTTSNKSCFFFPWSRWIMLLILRNWLSWMIPIIPCILLLHALLQWSLGFASSFPIACSCSKIQVAF